MAELKVLSNLMTVNEKALDKRNQLKWKTKWKTLVQKFKSLAAEKRKSYFQYRIKTIMYNQCKTIRNRMQKEIQSINFWKKFSRDIKYNLDDSRWWCSKEEHGNRKQQKSWEDVSNNIITMKSGNNEKNTFTNYLRTRMKIWNKHLRKRTDRKLSYRTK